MDVPYIRIMANRTTTDRRWFSLGIVAALLMLSLGLVAFSVRMARHGWTAEAQPARPPVEHYVSVDGTPQGDGTRDKPWDLPTAFKHPSTVLPGDTIWLLGGTYRGAFTSRLTGTPAAPITIRAVQGSRIMIDGAGARGSAVTIRGAGTTFWGLEVANSSERRTLAQSGSRAADNVRGDGVAVYGAHTRLINLVIHDVADGIGFWSAATDSEIYGCLIFNNGWLAPDRGHGQGIYIQNEQGTKRIVDVISFNNFSTGMKGYSERGHVSGLHFEGIASFNNGAPGDPPDTRAPNLFVGTTRNPLQRITITKNYFYHPAGSRPELGGNLVVGYRAPANDTLIVSDNHVVGGTMAMRVSNWRRASVTGNTFVANGPDGTIEGERLAELRTTDETPPAEYDWDHNTYFDVTRVVPTRGSSVPFLIGGGSRLTFEGWQEETGFDSNSRYYAGPPTGVRIFVRPNRHERGRGHIVAYNWDLKPDVEVPLGEVLDAGSSFAIYDVQDYFGEPVMTGRYDGGPVRISMTPRRVAVPVGYSRCGPIDAAGVRRLRDRSQMRTRGRTGLLCPPHQLNAAVPLGLEWPSVERADDAAALADECDELVPSAMVLTPRPRMQFDEDSRI